MFRYTALYINIISLFISIVIFCLLNFFISNWETLTENSNFKAGFEVIGENQETTNVSFSSDQSEDESKDKVNCEKTNEENIMSEWYLEIPSINLKANISEGTSKAVMDDYIGHFEDTPKLNGNIGLAAHNRGYKNNYFSDIKILNEGEIIYYYYKGKSKKYEVKDNFIISDTDWTSLENTEENMITLITCVENEPNYRRCVQAKEII